MLPHIHALHSLLLSESAPITGKKIHDHQNLMPEELSGWDSGYGWHERENAHYSVVREPKLYRTYSGEGGNKDTKIGSDNYVVEKQHGMVLC